MEYDSQKFLKEQRGGQYKPTSQEQLSKTQKKQLVADFKRRVKQMAKDYENNLINDNKQTKKQAKENTTKWIQQRFDLPEDLMIQEEIQFQNKKIMEQQIEKFKQESNMYKSLNNQDKKEAIKSFEDLIQRFEQDKIDYTDYENIKENEQLIAELTEEKAINKYFLDFLFKKGIIQTVKKSDKGGSYQQLFQEKETEDYYCPNSYGCFFSCVKYYIKTNEMFLELEKELQTQILEKYEEHVISFNVSKKLINKDMPSCNISDFIKQLCEDETFIIFNKNTIKDKQNNFIYNVCIQVKNMNKFEKISDVDYNYLGVPINKDAFSKTNLFRRILNIQDNQNFHRFKFILYKQHYFLAKSQLAAQQIVKDFNHIEVKNEQQDYDQNTFEGPSDIKLFSIKQDKYKKEQNDQEINQKIKQNKNKPLQSFFIVIYDIECFVQEGYQQTPYSCCYLIDSIVSFDLHKQNFLEINERFIKQQFNLINNIQQEGEHQQKIFYQIGENCVQQMLKHISQLFKDKYFKESKQQDQQIQHDIFMYAHNSFRYDNYVIINNIPQFFQIKEFSQKQDSCDINLQLKTKYNHQGLPINFKSDCVSNSEFFKQGKNKNFYYRQYFNFVDTFPFISQSLKKICEDFKIPKDYQKLDIEKLYGIKITDINKDNYIKHQSKWLPYLINDVISLAYVYNVFQYNIYQADQVYLKDFRSISHYSQFVFKTKYGGIFIQCYDNPLINNFLRKFIRAGRSFLGYQQFKIPNRILKKLEEGQKQNQNIGNNFLKWAPRLGLVAVDYTSLYPSACIYDEIKNKTALFLIPDLTSVQIIPENQFQQLSDDIHKMTYYDKQIFFLVVDYYVPEDNVFVCNVNKIKYIDNKGQKQTKTLFNTGFHQKQYLTSIQLEDAILYNNAKIIKIHYALTFTKYNENHYDKFMRDKFEKRQEIRKINEIMGNIIKLQMNSIYGKTIQKPQKYSFKVYKDIYEYLYQKKNIQIDEELFKSIYLINDQIIVKNYITQQEQGSNYTVNGIILLSISQRLMNKVIAQIDGFKQPRIYYMDTDSIYIEKKYLNLFDKTVMNDSGALLTAKNDLGGGSVIVKADFLMKKVKRVFYVEKGKDKIMKKLNFKGIKKELWDDDLFDILMQEKKLIIQQENKQQEKEKEKNKCIKTVQNQTKILKKNFKLITGLLVSDTYVLKNNFNIDEQGKVLLYHFEQENLQQQYNNFFN